LQLEFFASEVCEIEQDGVRYVLRRNRLRAQQLADSRSAKQTHLEQLCQQRNRYLAQHPRAKLATAEKAIGAKVQQLKLEAWLTVRAEGRALKLEVHPEALEDAARLDGCYVLKTDLPATAASAQTVHDRYKDLTQVEQAFRTCKTTHLETRPIHVRTAEHTRSHVLVVMLAYLIRRALSRAWARMDGTVEEGLRQLQTLCAIELRVDGGSCLRIPQPTPQADALLKALNLRLPEALPHKQVPVVTRKKLPERRKLL